MKTTNILKSISTLGLAGLFVFAQSAGAQGTVTVEKVSGTKAIVKFKGTKPVVGESYDLGGGDVGGGEAAPGSGSRAMYIGLNTTLISKTLAEGNPLSFNVAGTPGWNMGMFEVGVPLSMTFTGEATEGAGSRINASGGIDFDFNFVKNEPGVMFVPYAHGVFSFGMEKQGETNTKTMSFGLGGGIKYFLNDQVAVTAALDFIMSKSLVEGAVFLKTIRLPIGIRAYF